jgi:hypothetical protein
MLNILLRLKTVMGPVATPTTERYRVKVAFLISIRFQPPEALLRQAVLPRGIQTGRWG